MPDRDRVGLGWRPELAAGIVANLDRIDVVEVIADDYFDADRRALRALRTLTRQVLVVLHGVGLGLASAVPVETRRLERLARVVEAVEPEAWSEHLAFVRGGGVEIGHLAAPPRNAVTVEGAALNLERARRVVGSLPLLENVATLIDPPGTDRDEPTWITDVLAASGAGLLLDLHNLHANALNFGFDAQDALGRLPVERIGMIHVAGGRWIGPPGRRLLLDDHLHAAGCRLRAPGEPRRARPPAPDRHPGARRRVSGHGSAPGRARPRAPGPRSGPRAVGIGGGMTSARFEAVLARLYADEFFRRRFLASPFEESARAGLDEREARAMAAVDPAALEMAARSFALKRAGRRRRSGWLRRLFGG